MMWQLYTAYKIKHTKYCGVFGFIYSRYTVSDPNHSWQRVYTYRTCTCTLTLSVADDTDSVRFASSYSAIWAGMLSSTAV